MNLEPILWHNQNFPIMFQNPPLASFFERISCMKKWLVIASASGVGVLLALFIWERRSMLREDQAEDRQNQQIKKNEATANHAHYVAEIYGRSAEVMELGKEATMYFTNAPANEVSNIISELAEAAYPDTQSVSDTFSKLLATKNHIKAFILDQRSVNDSYSFSLEIDYLSKDIDNFTSNVDYKVSHQAKENSEETLSEIQKMKLEMLNKINSLIGRAATNNLSDAQFLFGKFYFEGLFLNKNHDLAIFWLNRAASNKSHEAVTYLARIRNDQREQGDATWREQQRIQFDKQLLAWQFRQASNNVDYSQFDLGMRYVKGNGVEPDQNTGLNWIRKSAAQNYQPALTFLKTNSPAGK